MIKTMRVIFIIFLLACGFFLAAEQMPDRDSESTVPELADFHDIIYPIWHTAYPAKDYKALRGFVAEINAQTAKIKTAVLPGILREKKQAWENGLSELAKAVSTYNAAAASNDDQALLTAAEDLHSGFEVLVRAIRPVAKEIDAYHKILYVVYHKYLPEKNYTAVCQVSLDMVAKAEAVTKAELSPRLAAKTEAFRAAAAKLLAETRLLEAAAKSCLEKDIPSLVEKVHSAYQALEKVFK
jgi:hypothetical protein